MCRGPSWGLYRSALNTGCASTRCSTPPRKRSRTRSPKRSGGWPGGLPGTRPRPPAPAVPPAASRWDARSAGGAEELRKLAAALNFAHGLVLAATAFYLQARPEVLYKRVKKRDKKYERSVTFEYLSEVAQAYNQFFFYYEETPLLVVNTSDIDFVASSKDLADLIKEINNMGSGTQHFIPLLLHSHHVLKRTRIL